MKKEFFAQRHLSFSFVTAMAMVAVEVSLWVSIFCGIFLLWKWGAEKKSWPLLSRRWTALLSVAFLGQVLLEYRTLIGQEPAYTFLLALSALRVMDYENDRDHKFIVMLGFILLSVKALFNVDVYWIIPSGLAFWGLWYSLLSRSLQAPRKILNRIFLLSLPLAVVLFIVFPRFVLPWAISRGSAYGQIGFSDELNPGRVAEIVASGALAFRAKIDEIPLKEAKDLYWRGSVLNTSRGLSWRPLRAKAPLAMPSVSDGIAYDIALEPTMQNFLFTLPGTVSVSTENGPANGLVGQIFRAVRPVQATTMYRGVWSPSLQDTQEPLAKDLEIPELEGRVRTWVQETLQKEKDIPSKLEALRRLFTQNGFRYTMNPGVYGANDLEEFLFERRRGFCEHFAGAYGTLARALGLPARVVAGYQGGRYNPLGDFWKVSQKDAHAWVEVFYEGAWQKVDPTFWIAPLRLIIGGEEFFSLSESDQAAFAQSTQWKNNQKDFRLWDQVTFMVENINYRWNYFLLDYDRTSQASFLSALIQNQGAVIGSILLISLLLFLLWRNLYQQKSLRTPEELLLLDVEAWAKKQKISRAPDETPLNYISRLQEKFPHLKEILEKIHHHYDLQVYAARSKEDANQLRKEWHKKI